MPLLLAAGMLMLTAAAEPDYSTPENTVRILEQAIKNADAKSAFQCYTESSKDHFPLVEFNNFFLFYQAPAANALGDRYSFEITETLKNDAFAVVKTRQNLILKEKTLPVLEQIYSEYKINLTAQKSREISKKLSEHFNGSVPSSVREIVYVLAKEKDGWKMMDNYAEMLGHTKRNWEELIRKNQIREAKSILHEFIMLCMSRENENAYSYLSQEQKKTLSKEELPKFSDNLLRLDFLNFDGRFPFEIAEVKENGDKTEITTKHTFVDNKAIEKDLPELEKRYPDIQDEKEAYNSLYEFYRGKIPTATETITYHLVKENGEWKITLPQSALK